MKGRRLPQVDKKVLESGSPARDGSRVHPSGSIRSVEEMLAALAHEVNNPLAVVIANLDYLAEIIAEMGPESGAYLTSEEAREWLRSRLGETEICLDDLRQATQRIRDALQNAGQERRPGGRVHVCHASGEDAIDPKTYTKRNILRHARILVVDDEQAVARALQRTLRGYDVVALASAREALSLLEAGERFDVILCDVMMPEMTGFHLHDKIREIAPGQAQRVIFLTGGVTTEEGRQFLETASQPVLTKPADAHELRALIQTFLG